MEEGLGPTRTVRLTRLQHLLFRNARGLTTAELAGMTGRSQRTIERDIRALGEGGRARLGEGKSLRHRI